jgi:chorismate--pyruvate lyase
MPIHHVWHTPKQSLDLPPVLRWWLMAEGSLTKQLTAQAHGHFRVQPFYQAFARPSVEEARFLGVPIYQRAWIREVELYGSDPQAWVRARSVIPISTVTGRGRRLRHLGSRSLGSLLFARQHPRCSRQVARLPLGWARRSRYVWHGQPLLVQEIFLTRFEQHLRFSE